MAFRLRRPHVEFLRNLLHNANLNYWHNESKKLGPAENWATEAIGRQTESVVFLRGVLLWQVEVMNMNFCL